MFGAHIFYAQCDQCRTQPAGEPVQWTGWTEYPSAGRSVIGPWTGWTVWTGVLDRLDRLLHDSVLFRLTTRAVPCVSLSLAREIPTHGAPRREKTR